MKVICWGCVCISAFLCLLGKGNYQLLFLVLKRLWKSGKKNGKFSAIEKWTVQLTKGIKNRRIEGGKRDPNASSCIFPVFLWLTFILQLGQGSNWRKFGNMIHFSTHDHWCSPNLLQPNFFVIILDINNYKAYRYLYTI